MKQLSIAVLALLAVGCATDSDRYGGYDYGHSDDYYVVDDVVYGGSAGYGAGGIGLGHDPYWGNSGFAYYQRWPSYYVWAPYYDPYYLSGYGFGLPSYYWPERRGWSWFGHGYSDPWYFGYYDDHRGYGHHGRFRNRGFDDHVGDERGRRYRDIGHDSGRSARNEAVRLSTSRQPIYRKPSSRTKPMQPRVGQESSNRIPADAGRDGTRPRAQATQPVLRPGNPATPQRARPAPGRGTLPSATRPPSPRSVIGGPAERNSPARPVVSRPVPNSRPGPAAVPVRPSRYSRPIATTRVIAPRGEDGAKPPAAERYVGRTYHPAASESARKPEYRSVPRAQTPPAGNNQEVIRVSNGPSGSKPEDNPRRGKKRR